MSWKDLLQTQGDTLVFPWVGGRTLENLDYRTWTLIGYTPREFGWYRFDLQGRKAFVKEAVSADTDLLQFRVKGYLVGDRLVLDDVKIDPDPQNITDHSETVHLLEEGLDRFVRILAGRAYSGAPLIFIGQEMPLGPEDEVLNAFLDRSVSVRTIPGVTPALDAAFRMESHQRLVAEQRRLEAERLAREEELRREQAERRQKLVAQLGDGAGRRAMAQVDFDQAARAALAVSGAELLDIRPARGGVRAVKFRLDGRKFECTCSETLQIVDAGICLTAHHDDGEFDGGVKGDTWFTLESLPGVIREAQDQGKLVVFRHVD